MSRAREAYSILVVVFLLLPSIYQIFLVEAAEKCEGAIIFYWTEQGEDRVENMRNWGLLEEKLEDKFYSKFTDYFNPKNVYAYTVTGNCCWEVYGEEKYKGESHKLKLGFGGIPDYPKFNSKSMKRKES